MADSPSHPAKNSLVFLCRFEHFDVGSSKAASIPGETGSLE